MTARSEAFDGPAPLRTAHITTVPSLSQEDSHFLAYLRGVAIVGIVLSHLGGWIFPPYTGFMFNFVPVFFFLSGAVSYYSFVRSENSRHYLRKRIVSLLIPYYLASLFCISIYYLTHPSSPTVTFEAVLAWLTFRPTANLQGFPFGQVWFLHALVIIVLASPLLFRLYTKRPLILVSILLIPLALAGVQLVQDVHAALVINGHNMYKPIVHSFFFISGFLYFSVPDLRKRWLLYTVCAGSVALAVLLVATLNLRVDLEYHTYSPDLYYIASSVAEIAAILLGQAILLVCCGRCGWLAMVLRFMYRHTFSIFLLHTFAIWTAERYVGLVGHQGNYVMYASSKFTFVMGLTCVLAIPFTCLSNWMLERFKWSPANAGSSARMA